MAHTQASAPGFSRLVTQIVDAWPTKAAIYREDAKLGIDVMRIMASSVFYHQC